jgi:hypothetical protein
MGGLAAWEALDNSGMRVREGLCLGNTAPAAFGGVMGCPCKKQAWRVCRQAAGEDVHETAEGEHRSPTPYWNTV